MKKQNTRGVGRPKVHPEGYNALKDRVVVTMPKDVHKVLKRAAEQEQRTIVGQLRYMLIRQQYTTKNWSERKDDPNPTKLTSIFTTND